MEINTWKYVVWYKKERTGRLESRIKTDCYFMKEADKSLIKRGK